MVRSLRLASGLVLMAFVAGHLANLAIGMHSLAAMEAWRAHLMDPWRSNRGQWLLLINGQSDQGRKQIIGARMVAGFQLFDTERLADLIGERDCLF